MENRKRIIMNASIKIAAGLLFLIVICIFFPVIISYAYKISLGTSPLAIIVRIIYMLFFVGLIINFIQIFKLKSEIIEINKVDKNVLEGNTSEDNILFGVKKSLIRDRIENILFIKKYDNFINQSELSEISTARQGMKDDLPKYFAVILPLIGLIGTLIGLTLSVGGLETVVSALAEVTQLREGMKVTMEGMATAFDTTLVGAVGMIILRYFNMVTANARSSLMLEISEFVEVKILPRIVLLQTKKQIEKTDIKEVVFELIKAIKNLSTSNQQILNELKESLPFEVNIKSKKALGD